MSQEITLTFGQKAGHFFQRLFATLVAGLLVGTIAISTTISYGATIFSGSLSEHLASGIGLALFSGLILTVVVIFTSDAPGAVAIPKAATSPILALIAVQIAAALSPDAAPEVVFITVSVAFAISALLVGTTFFVFGSFKLGDMIRFMPYPVFGGYLAGLGWLLIKGGLKIMANQTFLINQFAAWLKPSTLIRWLPGVIFALLLLWLQQRFRHGSVLPLALLASWGLFYLVTYLLKYPVEQLSQQGWLLGPFPDTPIWQVLTFNIIHLQSVRLDVVSGQLLTILTLVPASLLSLLLDTSSIELAVERDLDLNRELRAAGLANLFTSLGFGLVGFQSASLSALTHKMGAFGRLTGFLAAALFGVTLFYGAAAISLVPKILIGGLLIYLGFSFLMRWVIQARTLMPKYEYIIMLLIFFTIINAGLVPGILAGIVATMILFAITYSRIRVVRSTLSGKNYRSHVDRAPHYQSFLRENGEAIFILKLQGFIFFGTAFNLLHQVQQRVKDKNRATLQFLILDFQLVNGIDSSALNSFIRIRHLAKNYGFDFVVADIDPQIENQMIKGQALIPDDKTVQQLPSLDHAAAWCEDKLISAQNVTLSLPTTIKARLTEAFHSATQADRLIACLEKQTVDADTVLIHAGDAPRGICFIEHGQITVRMTLENGAILDLARMDSGTLVGEISTYLGTQTSATVISDTKSIIYWLSLETLERLEKDEPALAVAFHKFMAAFISQRLINTNTTLQALLDQ